MPYPNPNLNPKESLSNPNPKVRLAHNPNPKVRLAPNLNPKARLAPNLNVRNANVRFTPCNCYKKIVLLEPSALQPNLF